ncbi:SigE family RNA polymerase sigma factor [Kribbella sp. NPDC051770]|uniref:SigE family RNA polymerase sigma factor n=1 Tax=Kribbella sp. NPDC051770 TaxID=3155413 RepID=UPI00343F6DAE
MGVTENFAVPATPYEEPARLATDADFEGFVTACYPQLVRTAFLLTQDRQLAEDHVQTALLRCWRTWGGIRAADPYPYVRRTLLNVYFAWWRRSKDRPEHLTDTIFESGVHHGSVLVDNADLLEALRRLPKKMRAIVVLRYFEDLSEADIAAALGCSAGTVKSQSSRALAKLRLDPELAPAVRS